METNLVAEVEELGRGIFSKADREFLQKGRNEYIQDRSRQAADKREDAIKKRVRASLFDFNLLADPDKLNDNLLRDIFDFSEMRTENLWMDKLVLAEMIAFVHRSKPDQFEDILKDGINRSINRLDPNYTVNEVRVQIENPEEVVKRGKEKIENHERLSDVEVRVMLQQGEIEPNSLANYVRTGDHPYESEQGVSQAVDSAVEQVSNDDLLEYIIDDYSSKELTDEQKKDMVEENEDEIRDALKEEIKNNTPAEVQMWEK